jgi:hypothetical protein
MRRGEAIWIFLLFSEAANSAVKERDINYEAGNAVLRGSLAYDDALPGRRPVVGALRLLRAVGEFAYWYSLCSGGFPAADVT